MNPHFINPTNNPNLIIYNGPRPRTAAGGQQANQVQQNLLAQGNVLLAPQQFGGQHHVQQQPHLYPGVALQVHPSIPLGIQRQQRMQYFGVAPAHPGVVPVQTPMTMPLPVVMRPSPPAQPHGIPFRPRHAGPSVPPAVFQPAPRALSVPAPAKIPGTPKASSAPKRASTPKSPTRVPAPSRTSKPSTPRPSTPRPSTSQKSRTTSPAPSTRSRRPTSQTSSTIPSRPLTPHCSPKGSPNHSPAPTTRTTSTSAAPPPSKTVQNVTRGGSFKKPKTESKKGKKVHWGSLQVEEDEGVHAHAYIPDNEKGQSESRQKELRKKKWMRKIDNW